ncbi:hypothetical protein HZA73_06740 [candidate division TA06 bacterium]|nr:hypothetical protein [candidate division TA06 bacterium]
MHDSTRKNYSGDFFRLGPAAGQKGIALISAILVGFIILSLVLAWSAVILSREKGATREQKRFQARYTALSGLVKSRYNISRGAWAFKPGNPEKHKEQVFLEGGDCEIELGQEAGYYKITSTGIYKGSRQKVTAFYGLNPDSAFPCALMTSDPRGVILNSGCQVTGDISAQQPPQNRGGSWQGNYKTGVDFPVLNAKPLDNYIAYCQDILANPHRAGVELFSPQSFNGKNPLPDKEVIYVNDNVLFYGDDSDSILTLKGPKTIVSTADIQVSGWIKLDGFTLIAAGKITLLDNSSLYNSVLFSNQQVDVIDEAVFGGMILSPADINSGGSSVVKSGSVIYSSGQPRGNIRLYDNVKAKCSIISSSSDTLSGVHILDEAAVEGFIYSQYRVEINGTVHGPVVAGKLYKSFAAPPDNQLSGTIERRMGQGNVPMPDLFNYGSKLGWLKEINPKYLNPMKEQTAQSGIDGL